MRGGYVVGALAGALVLMATAGCSSGATKSDDAKGASASSGATAGDTKPAASTATIAIAPADGTTGVKPTGEVKVTAGNGKLTSVKVTGPDGVEVPGQIGADGSWAPTGALQVATAYTVDALAEDAKGAVANARSGFTTLTPDKEAGTSDNIADNGEYGVGMIVSVTFKRAVKNKDAVLGGITFEASDGTTVKGHWFGDKRVDFRPENYWKPGTKVTIHYKLKNVETSPGVYGDVDKDEPFTIGRSQISTVDVNTHKMAVVRDGQQVDTVEFTAGKPGYDTWNGVMVVEAKEGTTRMTSAGVTKEGSGDEYDLVVPHAMRLTDSGTYVHGNSWSAGVIGHSNGSHGCIGVTDTKSGSASAPAGKLYDSSLVGDVFKVVNSKGKTVDPSNGLSGWNTPWAQW
ncbi:Ig-like domain-containing protein [Kitasatospora sp. YST-16]|uniref:L,D-transpeptidase n=1 Tax=Kitasatospora sp. YST-16 TaxID=2998080 RepID=UPI0022852C95|nr:Ig-like domain-containing protein [Kitasatospora sp. YST-16]WAL73916.1 Ig-like domain-containing protein [Kitasatospora sp. YST-16]WNW39990.1 Ig-like domain-containing protein [Streptomyces sp. Li-HN-5-13]